MKRAYPSVFLGLALALVLAIPARASGAEGFTDLEAGAWYLPAVEEAVASGSMQGTGGATFGPYDPFTRAQLVEVLYDLEGRPQRDWRSTAFSDVDGQWYAPAARWAASAGLCADRAGGSFGGGDTVSRAETAQIVAKYCWGKGLARKAGASAAGASDYAAVPQAYQWGVNFCLNAGIMAGNERGELDPLGGLTRAEFAQVLQNLNGYLAASKVGSTVLFCSLSMIPGGPEDQTVQSLSDRLYDATQGRYSLRVFTAGTWGSDEDAMEMVRAGELDLAVVPNGCVTRACPDFAILDAPYVFDDGAHQERVFRSGVLDELFAAPADSGFEVLAAYGTGPYGLYTREPFTAPEQLAGRKIRAVSSPDVQAAIHEMGADAVVLPFTELYLALRDGTLDGGEAQIEYYRSACLYEVAPYYTLTGHRMGTEELIVSADTLAALSAEDRAALNEVCAQSVETLFDLAAQRRAGVLKQCADELGVHVNEIDVLPFRERLLPLAQAAAGQSEVMQGVYQTIQGMR